MQINYPILHYTNYTTLHYITLHYTTLHYTNYIELQNNTIIALQLQQLLRPQLQQQYQLHRATLHCTNYTAAHCNYKYTFITATLHSTAQHYSTLH